MLIDTLLAADLIFTPLDTAVFLVTLVVVMGVGLYAGRKEKSSEDYFLAGRSVRWWGVAGSIFGSNVSANHIVGMLGIGYSIGFAQSHFELGAIAGLMLLCYGFLPVYRKLRIYTLSDYLGQRYDERSRIVYAVLMVVIMVIVQMVPGLYIGSRSMGLLLEGSPLAVDYMNGVWILAVIAAGYTILGGLKAVIITDVIQSVLLLAAGILVAFLTFAQSEIGGWAGMRAMDAAQGQKMHLYLPTNHADLPWSGALTGLMFLHFFYWGTNQFIVQRTLAARSDREARLGIVTAGFFKLLIPFFAIGTGVASYYLFEQRAISVDPDVAFPRLVSEVIPLGYGLVGLIAAGLIGAILSSVDSMMNSSATIVTIDVYQRYIRREASEKELVWVGRLSIVVFVALAACLAMFVLDPESDQNFFLIIVDQQSHIIPGLLVAFALGMFWRGATATGAFVTVLAGPVVSFGIQYAYANGLAKSDDVVKVFGPQLNMLHRVALAVVICAVIHVVVSFLTRRDPERVRLTWTDLGGHKPSAVRWLAGTLVLTIAFFAGMAALMVYETFPSLGPTHYGVIAALWTLVMFMLATYRSRRLVRDPSEVASFFAEDRVWAGVLCSIAAFMMFHFY